MQGSSLRLYFCSAASLKPMRWTTLRIAQWMLCACTNTNAVAALWVGISKRSMNIAEQAASFVTTALFGSLVLYGTLGILGNSDLREKVRVQEPDCDSPENQFGTCEFHTHRKGDICHVSLAMIVQGRRLIITNLPIPMTEDDLMDFVARYSVTSTSIPSTAKNPRRHAFINLSSRSEAERAIVELNGKQIRGRKISVLLACKPALDGVRNPGRCGGDAVTKFNDGAKVTRDVNEAPISSEQQERSQGGEVVDKTRSMDKVAASYPVFSNLSRPPTPPAGYTWYPQPKWALAQTSQAPENNVNQFGSHIRFEDRNGGQYQQYTGNGSFDNQHGLVNSDESSDPSTNHQQFQGQWFGPAMDSSNTLHRATAPSLPIKDEDPMSGIDLYGADDQPATSKQQQLKVEHQEPLNLPTPPTNSSQRRDNPRIDCFISSALLAKIISLLSKLSEGTPRRCILPTAVWTLGHCLRRTKVRLPSPANTMSRRHMGECK
ncbi:hypothetical protein V8E51_007501 [Hyaloscypha variabilis]